MCDKAKGIDIIIPIYNAYEDLTKCILSVWKHTDLVLNRLILVNDKSPDERIEPYLASIAGGNVIVHNSEQNGGFSASVNIGMQCSEENDVILLNSDTIVTERWLEKIRECAYSEDNIGTVIPLSNSATLASVPIFGQDNPIPSNVTIDEMADIVERCSFKEYPQITVAVGFCMFIKRKLIKEIGLFDAETFGRGYGEENDFCCRAELMGYKHILCDNTFVYHKGTGSFLSEEKKALIDSHVKVLEERYPAAMRNNHLFCMSNPYQHIRDNINMYLHMQNGKKNILYILHNDFRDDATNSVGGTQLHVKDLTCNLRESYNIFVLVKEQKCFRLSCYIGEDLYTFEFQDDNANSYPLFRDAKQAKMLENILNAFRIELVHVHHVAAMSLEVYYVANSMNIPVITSIHDFYMLCPTYFMYNLKGEFCQGCNSDLCAECMTNRIGIHGGEKYIVKWQKEMQNALRRSSMLVYPSNSAKKVVDYQYSIDCPFRVIGHGVSQQVQEQTYITVFGENDAVKCNVETVDLIDNNIVTGWAFCQGMDNRRIKVIVQLLRDGKVIQEARAQKTNRMDVDEAFGGTGEYQFSGFEARILKAGIGEGTVDVRILLEYRQRAFIAKTMETTLCHDKIGNGVRVAFVGGLSDVKGSENAYEMVKQGTDVEWFVFGNISPNQKLANLQVPNLHKFGAYDRKDIGSLLKNNQIDVVCILSKCAETFCYTLTEAWSAQIPVIGYDMGAVGERIKETGAGIAVPVAEEAKKMVDMIRNFPDSAEWEKVRRFVESLSIKTDVQMAEEYREVYEELLNQGEIYYDSIDARYIQNALVDVEKIKGL